MRFKETQIPGVVIVEVEPAVDDRGSFARTFCEDEFAFAGIAMRIVQTNLSRNSKAHTLRGMHYQAVPYGEPKVVQCVRGSLWDVAVDLRAASPTFRRWVGVELTSTNGRMLYIPEGCAHGFITFEDNTEVSYLMGAPFVAGSGRGVRWNDPAFGIEWPVSPAVISEKDATYPSF